MRLWRIEFSNLVPDGMTNVNQKPKGRKAWLVLWESWHGHGEYLEQFNLPAFVAALPPNLRSRSVLMILKTLWAISRYSDLEDKIASGSSPKFPKEWIQDRSWRSGSITLGYDPFLTARKVENLRVLRNESGKGDLHWVSPAELGVDGNIIPARSMVLKHGERQIALGKRARRQVDLSQQVGQPAIAYGNEDLD
jgi:hypothetical protein